MEIKRNGKVEHSTSTHDDQVFSMLMALYVWYEGVNLSERFGIKKCTIKTDDEVDEQLDYYNDASVEIVGEFNTRDDLEEEIERDLNAAMAVGGKSLGQFLEERAIAEQQQFNELMNTPLGEKAYRQMYNIPDSVPIQNASSFNGTLSSVPDSVFLGFYNPSDNTFTNSDSFIDIPTAPESQINMLNDETYQYDKHFNF